MRPYRGKTKDGKWVYGSLIKTEKHTYIWEPHNKQHGHAITKISYKLELYPTYEVVPETIGQSTGLHDKNGKEIYEGDIVKWEHDSEKYGKDRGISKVHYRNGCFHIGGYYADASWSKSPEVIGDIHTNPELLEQD